MKRFFAVKVCICLLCLFGAWDRAGAGEYYVAPPPWGNDANDGSQGHPFATVTRALNAVAPGDTVWINDGVYKEYVNNWKSGAAGADIVIAMGLGIIGAG